MNANFELCREGKGNPHFLLPRPKVRETAMGITGTIIIVVGSA
jgi:hypothetical protein